MKYQVYHALGEGNPQCLPGQDYTLVGSIEATDTYDAYLRSLYITPTRHTIKGDVLHDLDNNQCYIIMSRGLFPINNSWIQAKP